MDTLQAPLVRYRLPLFPLPVVLLPGTPMPLHIFEQRYRDMVTDALEGDRRFGMIYHDWDEQGPFLSEEGRIGCVAEIRKHELLPDGRSLLVVEGVERFQIQDGIESDSLYFEALVSPYGDDPELPQPLLMHRRDEVLTLFREVVDALVAESEELPELPRDTDISFVLAHTIQGSSEWHQSLIESRDEADRLAQLSEVFRAALGESGGFDSA